MPRKRRETAIWLAGASILVLLLSSLLSPTVRYVCRAAWAEGQVLRHRRPISEVIVDPATSPADRAKLRLVLAARNYAADSIGLAAGRSFTTYTVLPHDTLVLVLSAAYRDRLQPVTWWFPIVGAVPYKGYFDFAAAVRAARAYEARGFDTNVRPSPAFSTLGFFSDPVVSTTLEDDSLELANTVIHELTHNTFYAAGQAAFNESFANFVGYHGAAAFFRARHGADSAARLVDAEWSDVRALGAFWAGVYGSLDSAFRAHPASRAARLAARDTIDAQARVRLLTTIAPQLRLVPPAALAHVRFDNASLLARRVYITNLDDFEAIDVQCGHDLRRTVRRIIALARSDPADPFRALARAARAATPAAPATAGAPPRPADRSRRAA